MPAYQERETDLVRARDLQEGTPPPHARITTRCNLCCQKAFTLQGCRSEGYKAGSASRT